jgi:hypothetical protein
VSKTCFAACSAAFWTEQLPYASEAMCSSSRFVRAPSSRGTERASGVDIFGINKPHKKPCSVESVWRCLTCIKYVIWPQNRRPRPRPTRLYESLVEILPGPCVGLGRVSSLSGPISPLGTLDRPVLDALSGPLVIAYSREG